MDQEVERKVIAILKVINEAGKPTGSTEVARRLKQSGIELSERAVRYHFRLLDERGLTNPEGRDGRTVTQKGREELRNALVGDKVGFIIAKIEMLAFQTTFDWHKREGLVPMNVSFFPKTNFRRALQLMKPVFQAGLCVSEKVAVAEEGERLGTAIIPPGKIGFATACTIVFNGCLLKAGVPMESKFGGIIQFHNGKPLRFSDLINYSGTSLDPSEAFIRSKMTDVRGVMKGGNGKLLANFREIPALARARTEEVVQGLRECGFSGLLAMGEIGESVCEVPVEFNRVGMVLLGGLTPVAGVQEAGIDVDNHAMSIVMDYSRLVSVSELIDGAAAGH